MRSVWEEEEHVYKYTLMSKISCINGFSRKAAQHCEKPPASLFKKKNQPIELGQYRNNVWMFYRNLSNRPIWLCRENTVTVLHFPCFLYIFSVLLSLILFYLYLFALSLYSCRSFYPRELKETCGNEYIIPFSFLFFYYFFMRCYFILILFFILNSVFFIASFLFYCLVFWFVVFILFCCYLLFVFGCFNCCLFRFFCCCFCCCFFVIFSFIGFHSLFLFCSFILSSFFIFLIFSWIFNFIFLRPYLSFSEWNKENQLKGQPPEGGCRGWWPTS